MKLMAEQVLSRQGWLARQPKAFQRLVFAESQLQQFESGASIYFQGDPPGGLYGLAAGAFGISIAPGDGGPFGHRRRSGARGRTPAPDRPDDRSGTDSSRR